MNKQYSKDEYEELVPKIIEHMKKTPLRSPDGSFAGYEWGEYFPVELSPHAYNETPAQEFFPLTKEEVLKRGWKWKDDLPFTKGKETIQLDQIPQSINDVSESICDEVLACEDTGKNFRITKQELVFYKQMNLPIPRVHFYERHLKRKKLRNPRQIWKRECGKCSKEIQTTYHPSRPEVVYCEQCYLKEVY